MMVPFKPGEVFPTPPPRADLPDKTLVLEQIMEMPNGCHIWLGDFRDTKAVLVQMRRRKRTEFQIVRVLYYFEHKVFPTSPLYRTCEAAGCVSLAHRTVGEAPPKKRVPQFARQAHSYAAITRGSTSTADIHGPRRTNGT